MNIIKAVGYVVVAAAIAIGLLLVALHPLIEVAIFFFLVVMLIAAVKETL